MALSAMCYHLGSSADSPIMRFFTFVYIIFRQLAKLRASERERERIMNWVVCKYLELKRSANSMAALMVSHDKMQLIKFYGLKLSRRMRVEFQRKSVDLSQ